MSPEDIFDLDMAQIFKTIYVFCYIECLDGTWGDNCALECGYCLDEGPCDKLFGICPYGCAPGFSGSNCTLRK